MNISLLGATGRVGNGILKLALADNHHVTALVRSQEKIQIQSENLTIVKGNALNKADIEKAISGTDIVCSALCTDGTTTLSKSIVYIVDKMKKSGIKRIVTVGTAGILKSRENPEIYRYESNESRRKSTTAAVEHRKTYEYLAESGLDWTVVCPTYLPDGKELGHYRIERDFLPEEGMKIHVPDVSAFTYEQLFNHNFNKSRVGITY